jgi:hypothetical protein
MKLKHNKKRNTAFLFETLVRELTRSVIRKDAKTKEATLNILKEYFGADSLLHKELNLYRSLCESQNLSESSANRLLVEVRKEYKKLDKKNIFTEQSAIIKRMNKDLPKEVFNTFVPNYKNLATVYQIFNGDVPPAKRILLEDVVLESMTWSSSEGNKNPVQVDNLVIKNFIKKFNQKYINMLGEGQSSLLQNYILSFSDNGVGLKVFLNEEIGRLKKVLSSSLKMDEIKQDEDMINKANKVLTILESFKKNKISKESLMQILKIQDLAREIEA